MAIDLTSNTIGWWKLNQTSGTIVTDNQGNYNGSTSDDISTITSENSPDGRDTSFYIKGDNNKVVIISDVADFSFKDASGDLPFSLAVWARVSGLQNNGTFISKMNGPANTEYQLVKSGRVISFNLFDNSDNSIFARYYARGIYNGVWHLIVATYDGRGGISGAEGMKLYIDGVEESPVLQTYSGSYDNMDNTNADVVLGGTANGVAYFDGFLADVMIFDKALTDGEVKYLYNDGFGISELLTVDPISSPTIIYPNGGELFTEGDINIQWKEPGSISSTELIWYEIFIVDDFNNTKKEELIQIATIPSGNISYSYTIQKNLRGKKSRIGIRSVNNKGLRSNMSFSADDFTIINEALPSPVLLEPVEGSTYFSYIPFVFDHNGVLGRSSQRSFYQIYYKSDSQDIDWTLLRSNIMVGTDPINIDVSSFNTNSDYVFKIDLVDGDNVSTPVFIKEININNINFFRIDTIPPVGDIKIIDNKEYTSSESLIIKVSASDETAVKDVQIQQTNIITGETNDLNKSPFVPLTPLLTWDIQPEGASSEIVDGVKLIQARFRDYGDNVLQSSDHKHFRTYKNLKNREVTVFIYNKTDESLYYTFASDETSGVSAELYKNLTFVYTLIGDATALEVYNNILYIAIKDDENKGVLQRLTGGSVNTISDNEQQYLDAAETVVNSLYSADSVINSMVVFDNTLFLGLDNGELLSFKGSSVSLEHSKYVNVKSIKNIRTDGIVLYIFFYNTTEILIMNKDESGNYIFTSVDTEN